MEGKRETNPEKSLNQSYIVKIVHNAHKIILKGGEDSMRKIYSGLT